ncbi:MAG: hypothetical protein AAGC72_17530 [Planctomycetota bacterium]
MFIDVVMKALRPVPCAISQFVATHFCIIDTAIKTTPRISHLSRIDMAGLEISNDSFFIIPELLCRKPYLPADL